MNYVHFFQWNIPADNHLCGYTDRYINVIATWDGKSFYQHNKAPIIHVNGVNINFSDCIQVLDWHKAHSEIEKLAEEHFAEIARQEKINQARAILAVTENPITERLTAKAEMPY